MNILKILILKKITLQNRYYCAHFKDEKTTDAPD